MALSLAIAFTVTPWLALRLMQPHGTATAGHATPAGLAGRLPRLFTRALRPLLDSARARLLLLAGILAALIVSVALTLVPTSAVGVVLKMLPFDNKSEFQLVVEMPAGAPLENTAAALQDMGAFLAAQPEVLNLQGYAGTASPITFNGLVRQYYLRGDPEQGDLQVNLVDKHHRNEQSHAIAQRLRPALEKIALRHGAKLKVVEVPPGPPVMSPLVAEVYGPDEAGRQELARRIEAAFAATPDIAAIDSTVQADAPRAFRACSASRPTRWASPWPRSRRRCRPRSPAWTRPRCTTATASTRCRCACSSRAKRRWAWTPCSRCRCAHPAVNSCRWVNWFAWSEV
jgi:multidrug efflux pump subunit AcrB